MKKHVLEAVALLLCFGFYLWLGAAPADAPAFLLAPVAGLASLFSGLDFVQAPTLGYLGATRGGFPVVIEKSCSGGSFFVILLSLLVVTQLRAVPKLWQKAVALPLVAAFAWVCTVVASALRIAASVMLLDFFPSPVLFHNIVGIATYLAMICAGYLIAQHVFFNLTKGGVVCDG